MVSYINLLLLLIAPQLICNAITVSPDSNIKNSTKTKNMQLQNTNNKSTKLNLNNHNNINNHNNNINNNNKIKNINKINNNISNNKTVNSTKSLSLADRNRRLIPYMTFYIPTTHDEEQQNYDAINQQYNSPQQYKLQKQQPLNAQIYQQAEEEEDEPQNALPIRFGPTAVDTDDADYIQQQRPAHPTYLENDSNAPPNGQQVQYISMHLPQRHNPTPQPQMVSFHQLSPSNVYENVRQQLQAFKYANVNPNQQHHQLNHQKFLHPHAQQQQQPPQHHQKQSQDYSNDNGAAKYHLQRLQPINHHALQQHSKHLQSSLINPLLMLQQQQAQQQHEHQHHQTQQSHLQPHHPVQHQQQEQQSKLHHASKVASSLFTPSNKIPGQFTPILFVSNPSSGDKNIEYYEKPVAVSVTTPASTRYEDAQETNNPSPPSNVAPQQDPHQHHQFLEQELPATLQQQQQHEQNHQHHQHHLQHHQHHSHHPHAYKYPIEYSHKYPSQNNADELHQSQHLTYIRPSHYHPHSDAVSQQQQQQKQHQPQPQPQHVYVNPHSNQDVNSYEREQSDYTDDHDQHIVTLAHLHKQQQNMYHQHKQEQPEKAPQSQPNTISHVHNIVSTTQRPTYKLVTEVSQRYNQNYVSSTARPPTPPSQPPPPQSDTSDYEMTNEQRYVAYLQQQLRQKYPNRYKEKEHPQSHKQHQDLPSYSNVQIDPYLVGAANPSPQPPENHLYADNQRAPAPSYPKYIYAAAAEEDKPNKSVHVPKHKPSPTKPEPQSNYIQLVQVDTPQQYEPQHEQQPKGHIYYSSPAAGQSPSSTPHTILVPVKHHQPQPQKNPNINQLYFVTTASPIHVTSVGPIYKYDHSQRLQPVKMLIPSNHHPSSVTTSSSTTTPATPHTPSQIPNIVKTPIIIYSNATHHNLAQKNYYNVHPSEFHSLKSSPRVKPPAFAAPNAPDPTDDHLQKPLIQTQSVDTNATPYYHSYSQTSNSQTSSTHPKQHSHQMNYKSTKLPYRQYYQSQINPKLKLKPLQKVMTANRHHYDETPTVSSTTPHAPITSTESEIEDVSPQHIESTKQNHYNVETSSEEDYAIKQSSQTAQRPSQDVARHKLPNFKESASVSEILRKLQETNHLPHTITPDNIDNSIKTLIKILNNLKESQTIVENPPQNHEPDYNDYDDTPAENADPGKPGPNSGRPGIDYPNLSEIPPTSFNCKEQRYKGFFGDPETNCQVWHYCDLNGGQASFLCPNGTIFSQVALTCDWWFNVKCSTTAQLYVLNERLYKYILPFTPKFPEDYSGPLVDKYLALKFKEMEEKMMRERENESKENDSDKPDTEDGTTEDATVPINTASEKASEEESAETAKSSLNENDKEHGLYLPSAQNGGETQAVNLLDVEENRGTVDTGITYNTYSSSSTTQEPPLFSPSPPAPPPLTVKPIYVPSTAAPATVYSSTYASPSSTTTVDTVYKQLKLKPQNRLRLRQRLKLHRNRPSGATRKPKVDVESEKVEVIEIKSDGSSGHIIPNLPPTQHEYVYAQ